MFVREQKHLLFFVVICFNIYVAIKTKVVTIYNGKFQQNYVNICQSRRSIYKCKSISDVICLNIYVIIIIKLVRINIDKL